MTDDECRRSFEKWAIEYGVSPVWDEERGIYSQQLVQFMYRAYCAGQKSKPEGVDIAAQLAATSHLHRAIEHIETAIKVTAKE